MKILMIGTGSIGMRHLRNIVSIFAERSEAVCIDALRSGNRALPEDIQKCLNKSYFAYEELPHDYDVAFICNPTSLHYETLRRMWSVAKHFFIEKPVFSDISVDMSSLIAEENRVCYVAAPLRYTRVLRELKEIVSEQKVCAVRAICSTYLPDWRPGVDYRTCYSAHKDMGGGVSIDLIHEWDYLCHLFGFPQKVYNLQGQHSTLELHCEDISVYIAQYADKMISLHLDYFGRNERREVEIYTPEDTIVADIRHQQIRWMRSGKVICLEEPRDAYQKQELIHFFNMIDGKAKNDNTIEEALMTLRIASGTYA